MLSLAQEVPFHDPGRAAACLSRISGQVPLPAGERIADLLQLSANPDSAIHCLARFIEEQPQAFQRILQSHSTLQYLLTLFSYSAFLSEEVIKAPDWIEGVGEAGELHLHLPPERYREILDSHLPAGPPNSVVLAAFRRRQLVRIVLRDVLGLGTLAEITEEISSLADAILHCTFVRLREALVRRHGVPRCGAEECQFSILALGKHGGQELNYSSDIDLMFLFAGNGQTDGAEPVTNREFYKRVCVQLTELLSTYTPHGICYRVDLRLRPEGTLGEVCLPLDAAKTYYQKRARDWELQMLIKARVAAGDMSPGRDLLEFVEPFTYSTSLDFSKIEAVSEARVRISEKLAKRRGSKPEFDIKLAPGGIRDIEFLVQCLQRLHGGREPWVRHGGTQLALFRLHGKELLSDIEYGRLLPAYQFLRDLEHRLQFADDRQTHSLPAQTHDLDVLARRMPATEIGGKPSAATLRATLDGHLDNVRAIYDRVVHAQLPLHYQMQVTAREPAPAPVEVLAPRPIEGISPNLARILRQQAPDLADTLARSRIRYGATALEHFLERILPAPQWLGWLNDDPVLTGYLVDIFEHSPFFAGQLNRKPEWVEELYEMRRRPQSKTKYEDAPATLADPTDLRRFFNREMLRIQAESICLQAPVFDTLARTSALADCAISTAYQMALASASDPPASQMMVIALGRLGMQELDLGSDADLIFVVADQAAADLPLWTRIAEKTSELLTAYTGDGTLFAVDTRLRPNGGAGPLVQTVAGYLDYFARKAQAWEGITYMKSRTVAGGIEAGTKFLESLQETDWRRYGQGGRSRKELRQMRMRLENEAGKDNPLKAGRGGYYDIDFALMYLRLKSA
ncbi:MAG: glutamine-synthetase adenylyltransferase, partial [Acidobacteria bacterium]|nr:glutamine-synthetase adenylyltransferase [Acidobacteriota bacterium]